MDLWGLMHGLWNTSMVWLPPPVRLIVFAAICLLVLLRGLPWLLRVAGAGLQRSEPAVAALTYPEFLVTSLARRFERPPVPGTMAYGRALGGLHHLLVVLGTLMAKVGQHRAKVPRMPLAVLAVAVSGVWYVAPEVPSGQVADSLLLARAGLVSSDTWLMTGATAPSITCPSVAPVKPGAKPRPTPTRSTKKR